MATFAWPAFSPKGSPADSDHLLDAARTKAREEGYAEGQQQALAEQAQMQASMAVALQDLIAQRDRLLVDHQAALTDLLFKALEALLRVELATNPNVVATLVAEALDVLNAKLAAVSVRANPQDLERMGDTGDIEVVADDTVPVGGLAVARPDKSVEFDLLGKLRNLAALSDEQWQQQSEEHTLQDRVDEPNAGNP